MTVHREDGTKTYVFASRAIQGLAVLFVGHFELSDGLVTVPRLDDVSLELGIAERSQRHCSKVLLAFSASRRTTFNWYQLRSDRARFSSGSR